MLKKRENKIKQNSFFYSLDESVTGLNRLKKIKNLRKKYFKKKIELMLITSSENVAWLLNIRGHDSNFSPIPNSYLIIDKKIGIFLFCNMKKINSKLRKKLSFIKVFEFEFLENFLKKIKNKNFSIDNSTCSIFYKDIIKKNNKIVNVVDPIYFLKSQKNTVEINNTKKIHEYDGAALTKFLFWINSNFEKEKITEIKAQNKLLYFKKKFKHFRFPSFPTISSTGSNGAIVHYNASKKTNKILKNGNIYLIDSGGQYFYGTTDVTRTVSLNSKSERVKEIFTRVLQGHLNLSNSKIKKNTSGSFLDRIARKFGERGAPKENIATVADIVKRSRRLKNININNGVKYWCDFESEVKIALRYTKPFRKRTKKFAKATKTLNAWAALCIRNNMDKECKMVLGLLGDQIVLPGEQTKLMRGALDVWHDNLVSDLSHDKTLWLVFVLLCSLTDAVQRYPKGDTEFPLAPHDVIALASARDARKNVKKYSATLDKFTK